MTLPSPLDSPIIREAEAIRAAMLNRDLRLMNDLVREYARAYRAIRQDIKRIAEQVALVGPSRRQVFDLAAMQSLLDSIQVEIAKFAKDMGAGLERATAIEINAAGLDAERLVQLNFPQMERARVMGTWSRIHPEQVYRMYGFVDPRGPLFRSLEQNFSKDVAELTREKLLRGFVMGKNPREIARWLASSLDESLGTGLNWAMSMARTSVVWSYRAASHANYIANQQVVKGWYWWAELDDRVCLSCVMQHGSFHPVTEILADHHLGRCAPLPATVSYAELGIQGIPEEPFTPERGEDWFSRQAEDYQKQLMGPAMWKAWKGGAVTFDQLSRPYMDDVYGKMFSAPSLKELLGAGAKQYYGRGQE